MEEEKERVTKMDGFDILPDTLHQHDTIHSKEDIQDYYILKKSESWDDQEINVISSV